MNKLTPLLLIVALYSCKKEEIKYFNNEQTPQTMSYSFTSTSGSYMVYKLHEIDSMGNDNVVGTIDTVFVLGDTVINGKTYTQFTPLFPSSSPTFLRDSSGYIVNTGGKVVYSYVNMGEVLAEVTDNYMFGPNGPYTGVLTAFMNPTVVSLQTEAEFFNETLQYHLRLTDSAGGPINYCGETQFDQDKYYANGIGLVRAEYAYQFSMMNECSKNYWDLIDYYIAP